MFYVVYSTYKKKTLMVRSSKYNTSICSFFKKKQSPIHFKQFFFLSSQKKEKTFIKNACQTNTYVHEFVHSSLTQFTQKRGPPQKFHLQTKIRNQLSYHRIILADIPSATQQKKLKKQITRISLVIKKKTFVSCTKVNDCDSPSLQLTFTAPSCSYFFFETVKNNIEQPDDYLRQLYFLTFLYIYKTVK